MRPLGLAVVALFIADVAPHCGGRSVMVRGPGESCASFGRHQAECREPAQCMSTDLSYPICTHRCGTNSDCADLGAGFACNGTERAQDGREAARSVCAKAQSEP